MDKLKGPISRIKDLLLRGIEMFGEARVSVYAGYATLFIVTAIFPCLMLIISIVNLIPGYSAKDVADVLFQILPDLGSIKELVVSLMLDIKDQSGGLLASAAAVTTLWAASKGVMAIQKGLNQVKNGNAFVSVGTLESNQTGRVKLEVKLDGNSQDNSYMEKLAQLSIQFATTPKTDFDPQNKTIEKKIHKTRQVVYTIPGGSEIVYIDDDEVPLDGGFNPKTGDSILPLLVCAIALVVGIGFIALYFIIEKKSNREVR